MTVSFDQVNPIKFFAMMKVSIMCTKIVTPLVIVSTWNVASMTEELNS